MGEITVTTPNGLTTFFKWDATNRRYQGYGDDCSRCEAGYYTSRKGKKKICRDCGGTGLERRNMLNREKSIEFKPESGERFRYKILSVRYQEGIDRWNIVPKFKTMEEMSKEDIIEWAIKEWTTIEPQCPHGWKLLSWGKPQPLVEKIQL